MTDETLQREIAGTMLPNDEFALAYPESVPDTCEMDAAVLIEAVVECLWRLYGYEPGIDGRHPETERVFRLDAVSLIEGIERAGYRIVAEGEDCECEDCYPELTRAAAAPLPAGVTVITVGWGEDA